MKRGQVFVRALQADGKWGNVDVLDLDEISFRAFIIDKLIALKALYSFAPKHIDGDEIPLKEVHK